MKSSRREGRALFLAYLCSAWVLVLIAAPLMASLAPASAGASRYEPSFGAVDRDADGYVSRREASTVAGLGDVLVRADLNRDGRLDQVEYARALGLR